MSSMANTKIVCSQRTIAGFSASVAGDKSIREFAFRQK